MSPQNRVKLNFAVIVMVLVSIVISEWLKRQDHGPDRDIVFLLETEKVEVHAVQVLRVPQGESLVSIGGAHRAEVVQTFDDPDELERLNVLLRRVQMGRKPLNHPATIARIPIRLQTDGGEYYVDLQYLRVKDELTILLRAGDVGDANANHANIYHLDGIDAIEWSKLVPPE